MSGLNWINNAQRTDWKNPEEGWFRPGKSLIALSWSRRDLDMSRAQKGGQCISRIAHLWRSVQKGQQRLHQGYHAVMSDIWVLSYVWWGMVKGPHAIECSDLIGILRGRSNFQYSSSVNIPEGKNLMPLHCCQYGQDLIVAKHDIVLWWQIFREGRIERAGSCLHTRPWIELLPEPLSSLRNA